LLKTLVLIDIITLTYMRRDDADTDVKNVNENFCAVHEGLWEVEVQILSFLTLALD